MADCLLARTRAEFVTLGADRDGFAVQPKTFHDARDSVVVEARYTDRYKATGKRLDAQVYYVWDVRDGKATRFRQYVDTAKLRDVMGTRQDSVHGSRRAGRCEYTLYRSAARGPFLEDCMRTDCRARPLLPNIRCKRVTAPMLAVVATLVMAPHAQAAPDRPRQADFLAVDGLDAEGVIVPEDRVDPSNDASRFTSRWTPSADEVRRLESGLAEALIAAGARPEIHERLNGYRRQYLGVIVEGRRRILVNAFWGIGTDGTDFHPDWRHRFVFVLDGGHDYWRIQFDVDTGGFAEFEQNGYA